MKNKVSISTITWARDKQEEAVLRESLSALANLNMPVTVSDGGSGEDFVKFLNSFPHFTVSQPQQQGLLEQVKDSLSSADRLGSPYIFYTEPDKLHFFTAELKRFLATASAIEERGVVLASRSNEAFATFPKFQQQTETAINTCCCELIGLDVDYTYGPFLLNRKLVPYLELVQKDIGWGWRPFLFALAKRLGYEVIADSGNFFCPAEQRSDDRKERIYRMRQLSQNIDGLVWSTLVDTERNAS